MSSVSFSPDGTRLVSGSDDKTIKVWDAATGQETLTLTGHTHYVSSVSFSPDGTRLVSGSWDDTVKVWILDFPTWSKSIRQSQVAWIAEDLEYRRTLFHEAQRQRRRRSNAKPVALPSATIEESQSAQGKPPHERTSLTFSAMAKYSLGQAANPGFVSILILVVGSITIALLAARHRRGSG